MDNATILIIDDELHIRQFLRAAFEFEGFAVQEAHNAEEGIRSATLKPPDLIILDLGLPDRDGSSIVERLRSWSNVPIIVLTVRSREREKVRLLELGADDYVVKPFGIGELIARARAALRPRVAAASDPVVQIGPLEINLATRSGMIDGKRVVLGPKEYLVLQILAQHAGKVVTRQQIMKQVWGASHLDDTHYLRIVVRNLRKKIEVDPARPRILLTELGVGYRLAR
jgi:two-component system, OmpR family, KDP operon response regulator KdpE